MASPDDVDDPAPGDPVPVAPPEGLPPPPPPDLSPRPGRDLFGELFAPPPPPPPMGGDPAPGPPQVLPPPPPAPSPQPGRNPYEELFEPPPPPPPPERSQPPIPFPFPAQYDDPHQQTVTMAAPHMDAARSIHQAVLAGAGVVALAAILGGTFMLVASEVSAVWGASLVGLGFLIVVTAGVGVLRSQHSLAALPPDAVAAPPPPLPVPVALFAFANDSADYLPSLKEEATSLWRVLNPLGGKLHVHRVESATIDEIFEALTTYHGRVCLFHYAGHADGTSLRFESGDTNSRGVAELLGAEPNLHVVFLNGCATRAQVSALWDAGVPAVLATRTPVKDGEAQEFASRFYEGLASGQPLGTAFERSVALLRAKNSPSADSASVHRALGPASRTEELPWGLWVNPSHPDADSWTLTGAERARPTSDR